MKKAILAAVLASIVIPAVPALADPHWNGRGHGHGDYNRGGYDRGGHRGGYQFRSGDRRLGRNDRIWRGRNGHYYCRRSNGTTGLIVGALAGGALGNVIADGRNSTLGTLLGAGAGGLIGSSIDRGEVRCR